MTDRETNDLYLGHPDYAGREHRQRTSGTDRFEVYVVYRDGVPRRHSLHDELLLALEERDREDEAHRQEGHSKTTFHIGVTDREDPERGDLDYDHLEED